MIASGGGVLTPSLYHQWSTAGLNWLQAWPRPPGHCTSDCDDDAGRFLLVRIIAHCANVYHSMKTFLMQVSGEPAEWCHIYETTLKLQSCFSPTVDMHFKSLVQNETNCTQQQWQLPGMIWILYVASPSFMLSVSSSLRTLLPFAGFFLLLKGCISQDNMDLKFSRFQHYNLSPFSHHGREVVHVIWSPM